MAHPILLSSLLFACVCICPLSMWGVKVEGVLHPSLPRSQSGDNLQEIVLESPEILVPEEEEDWVILDEEVKAEAAEEEPSESQEAPGESELNAPTEDLMAGWVALEPLPVQPLQNATQCPEQPAAVNPQEAAQAINLWSSVCAGTTSLWTSTTFAVDLTASILFGQDDYDRPLQGVDW